ncbi:flavin reductase family protein [Pseudarthrobacter sulfonivorans]|uniref:flavin reductase family protein n=1 Tax=Pseudarthrobacter sulfonivorans TaxID=121292 RepID=UPI0028594F67|nr:flavin reductase family protein [Pseudarthrobacter sulfonivorans]MDR6417532.1 flavin reductase (DIM6/NTAB) family NADH-FMN oxidoreductase RutF [Pseudarthrobacter sulfonivorans]
MSETTSELPAQTIDVRELRNAFGKFATGVTVVTCHTPDGEPHGATVNAFTAVSLDPPLAQVTLIRGNRASQYLEDQPFAINIMAEDQLDVCLNFAGKPMKGAPQWRSEDGVPVLCGTAATIECKPWRIYDGGDHVIVIGEVIAMEVNDVEPLLFVSGKFREVGNFSGGSPWDASGDSLSTGWFEGSKSFKSF